MAKVTFDWINKLIIVNESITELDAEIDLYSDWKEWIVLWDNSKYLPAFSALWWEPIWGGRFNGRTFFIINWWKVRPYEWHHELNIVWNIFWEWWQSFIVPVLWNYTVSVKFSNSNLVQWISTTWSSLTAWDIWNYPTRETTWWSGLNESQLHDALDSYKNKNNWRGWVSSGWAWWSWISIEQLNTSVEYIIGKIEYESEQVQSKVKSEVDGIDIPETDIEKILTPLNTLNAEIKEAIWNIETWSDSGLDGVQMNKKLEEILATLKDNPIKQDLIYIRNKINEVEQIDMAKLINGVSEQMKTVFWNSEKSINDKIDSKLSELSQCMKTFEDENKWSVMKNEEVMKGFEDILKSLSEEKVEVIFTKLDKLSLRISEYTESLYND